MANNAESKREKFLRIAGARTNKAAEMIRLLGNCANQTTYEFSDEDVKKIFTYLEKELKNARNKFNGSENEENKFSFS